MSGCSENQKHEVLLQYLCGHAPKEIANEVGVHFATVYRWINGWKKSLEGLPLTELPIQDTLHRKHDEGVQFVVAAPSRHAGGTKTVDVRLHKDIGKGCEN